MNFFQRQEESRHKTFQLIFLFILAVMCIVLAVYLAVIILINYLEIRGTGQPVRWFDPDIFLWVCVLTSTIILGGSLVKMVALQRGGPYVAESLGGRLILPSTSDAREKRLLNIVEEMSIASGVPVPMVYVMDKEGGINAFAAGYHPSDAAVAVTKGCLDQLSRDELQGVIGHEFSHILNGDMRLNIRLIGFISGIMILATIGYHMLRSAGRSRKGGGAVALMGLALIVIGYAGVFFARLIQSAVSRQREYLADASSVQFTRNPLGLANALKKIGGFSKGSQVKSPLAPEASHMFFEKPIHSIFATHPPLVDRIRRIDPSFTGDFNVTAATKSPLGLEEAPVMAVSGPQESRGLHGERVKDMVGNVSFDHVVYGSKMLQSIPLEIRNEIADPFGASALVCAMLLDDNSFLRKNQLKGIEKNMPSGLFEHAQRLYHIVSQMEKRFRLPVLDLAMPALRRMSGEQFDQFKQCLQTLVALDQQISLFEFCLQQIIAHRLTQFFDVKAKNTYYTRIDVLIRDAVKIISKLADFGHSDPSHARKAYEASVQKLLKLAGPTQAGYDPGVSFADLGKAISRIAMAKPGIKEVVFEACTGCVLFDRTVSAQEAELLRAIAYCFDLPMAPFLMDAP